MPEPAHDRGPAPPRSTDRPVNPAQQRVLRGLSAGRVRVVHDEHDDDAPSAGVEHVTGDRAHAGEGSGFDMRLPCNIGGRKAPPHRSVRGDHEGDAISSASRTAEGGEEELAMLRALMRSMRESPEPLSIASSAPGDLLREPLAHHVPRLSACRRAFARRSQGQKSCRAMTLLLYLLCRERPRDRVGARRRDELAPGGPGRRARCRSASPRLAQICAKRAACRSMIEQAEASAALAAVQRVRPASVSRAASALLWASILSFASQSPQHRR